MTTTGSAVPYDPSRRSRQEPECWQVARVGAPAPNRKALTRPLSASVLAGKPVGLSFWVRKIFEPSRRPSPYQVCLALHISETGRASGLR